MNVDFNSKFAESEAVLELLGNVQSFSRLISLVRNIVVNCKLELQRVLANLNFACGSSVGLCTCSPGGVRSSLLPTGMWEWSDGVFQGKSWANPCGNASIPLAVSRLKLGSACPMLRTDERWEFDVILDLRHETQLDLSCRVLLCNSSGHLATREEAEEGYRFNHMSMLGREVTGRGRAEMCVEALVKTGAFMEGNWGAQGTDILAGGHQFKSSLWK